MKKILNLIAGCLLILTPACAGTVASIYGQMNCFNLPGVISCPDGSNWETGLGGVFFTDYRTAAEQAAGSVADIWAAPGDVSFTMPSYSSAGAASATFSIQIAGIADLGGPFGPDTVSFDGTSVGVIPVNTASNGFQEVLTYTYSVPVALLNGADTIAINANGGDGFIIGYADITLTLSAPEPATLGLLLMGSGAVAAGVFRRRSA